jgi:hypothetical protein
MDTKDLAALIIWCSIGLIFLVISRNWGEEAAADRERRVNEMDRLFAESRARSLAHEKRTAEISAVLKEWENDWAKSKRPSWGHLTLAQRRAAISYPEEAYAEIDRGIDAHALYQRHWDEFNRKPRCYLCGKVMHLRDIVQSDQHAHVDHIVPLVAGGTHTWLNVALTHSGCNQRKAAGATKKRVGQRASLPAGMVRGGTVAIRKRPRIRKNRLGQTWGIE